MTVGRDWDCMESSDNLVSSTDSTVAWVTNVLISSSLSRSMNHYQSDSSRFYTPSVGPAHAQAPHVRWWTPSGGACALNPRNATGSSACTCASALFWVFLVYSCCIIRRSLVYSCSSTKKKKIVLDLVVYVDYSMGFPTNTTIGCLFTRVVDESDRHAFGSDRCSHDSGRDQGPEQGSKSW